MSKKAVLILFIIVISALSSIVSDRYLFPYLASTEIFQKYDFLKKSTENVTVINRTEQVSVKEDSSISKIASQNASSVVSIISYANPETVKAVVLKGQKQASPPVWKDGAGIIVTSDGMIMTYSSAINIENSKYKVVTYDSNSYDAELLGIDSWSNLAFLKIYASNLPAVSFGNSDDIRPGEKVVAVGLSLSEYQDRFAAGIVSDFDPTFSLSGKTLSSSEKMEGLFKTDLGWNKNYIGGPIIDYSGQVVAISGAIDLDGKMEYFQIPSNKAKLVMNKAISRELDKNYTLGIYYIPVTKAYSIANNLKTEKGALIYSPSGQQGLAIIAGSPASASDLRINDVITQVNGEEINLSNSLPDLLYKYKKGEEVELTVLRDGNEIRLKTTI